MPRSPALEGEELERAVEMKKNGASYPEIAKEFNVSQGAVYSNVKPLMKSESENERENERAETENERGGVENESERIENENERIPETKHETERLSRPTFRKALELFINGKNSEQIADHLDVSQEAVEYELLPYVNELKTARRLQKRFEEEVKCRI